jgi:hypothetical protein
MEHRNDFDEFIRRHVDQQERQTWDRPLVRVGLPVVSRGARKDRARLIWLNDLAIARMRAPVKLYGVERIVCKDVLMAPEFCTGL